MRSGEGSNALELFCWGNSFAVEMMEYDDLHHMTIMEICWLLFWRVWTKALLSRWNVY